MKLNKQLKIEGVVVMILLLLVCISVLIRFLLPGAFGIYDIFVVMLTSPLFVMLFIAVLMYWIYQVVRYQKQH